METRDNEYLKKYWDICDEAKKRILPDNIYIEKHHIYPKSIYGKNDITVNLTLQEHYLVHKYLWLGLKEKYGTSHKSTRSMANAFRYMCSVKKEKVISTPEEYELLRIAHYEANRGKKHTQEYKDAASIRNSGEGNAMYGRSFYDIWVEKYGEDVANIKKEEAYKKSLDTRIKNGTTIRSEECKQKSRISHLGKKSSDETKEKLKDIHANRTIEKKKKIAEKAYQTRIENNTLSLSEETKKNISLSKIGNKNPMYGKSVYSVWVEKYGEDEADRRDFIAKEKARETKRKNKKLKNNLKE